MSAWTAFKLSLQNLVSKRTRTVMTSIAGSIGIIGVSLVLSISFGMQTFIGNMQNDMLSGNPITVAKSGMNIGMIMGRSSREDRVAALKEADHANTAAGYVNVDSVIDVLASRASIADNIMLDNHITQEHIDYLKTLPPEYVAELFFNYGLDVTNNIYTDFKESADSEAENMSLAAARNMYTSVLEKSPYATYAEYMMTLTDLFKQLPENENYILSQYDLLHGRMASGVGDIVIVLENGSIHCRFAYQCYCAPAEGLGGLRPPWRLRR